MKRISSIALLSLAFALTPFGVQPAQAHSPAEEMSEAAQHFLDALQPEQKSKATFDFKDQERLNWHFIPRERRGLPLKEMNSAQRHLAQALLSSGLSHRGYVKATTIMSLEQILHDMEVGSGSSIVRDPELYFFSIFGNPASDDAWGWRVEGHHLSANFTVRGDHVLSVTPSFFGTNPAEVRQGPRKGLRVLADEEDLGRRLVKSLSDEQIKVAVINTSAPREIITGADRKVTGLQMTGIAASKLKKDQSDLLAELVHTYLNRCRTEVAERDWKAIQDGGWEKVHFSWAGGTEPGQGHYYRVQGPTFLLEFDNTQNNANHIHSVWRDLQNDFGEDLLREHYDQVPHRP